MSKQSPLGITGEARRLEGDKEVQCKLCNLIQRFAESSPGTTLKDLIDFELLDREGLCEEHIYRLSMRYEDMVKDCPFDQRDITVKMVNDVLFDVLPLAA